jgi:hypothetical protein
MGNEVLALLNSAGSVKIVCGIDGDGLPHPAVKDSLRSDGENILYFEYIESSETNRCMTRALWFDKKVAVLVVTPAKQSFLIKARPVRALVSGKEFQAFYREARLAEGGPDLSTVWILKPEEIIEQTPQKRLEEESAARPYFIHLDRLKRRDNDTQKN